MSHSHTPRSLICWLLLGKYHYLIFDKSWICLAVSHFKCSASLWSELTALCDSEILTRQLWGPLKDDYPPQKSSSNWIKHYDCWENISHQGRGIKNEITSHVFLCFLSLCWCKGTQPGVVQRAHLPLINPCACTVYKQAPNVFPYHTKTTFFYSRSAQLQLHKVHSSWHLVGYIF